VTKLNQLKSLPIFATTIFLSFIGKKYLFSSSCVINTWFLDILFIFFSKYSEYLEKNINKITNKQVFITHELENRYFFPINDKKIVVAKIGKDFSWFSFVTLFITLYGLILYIFGMINIYNVFNDTVTFYSILILTVVTFAIGYWWFVNNTGEKRLREVYDN
jgi:hypothetical protein